jgi:hypothetical protein
MLKKSGRLSLLKLKTIWNNSMNLYRFSLTILLLTSLPSVVTAQEKSFTLGDVSFLAGHWIGEAFGGIAEEIWSEPSSSAMMGMFRLQQNNSDRLYEFLLIEKTGDGIQMRFKHIKPNYIEMEDKPIILNLIDVNTSFAHFETEDQSLIIKYNLTSDDILEIELTSTKEGRTNITPITMTKKQ